MDGSRVEGIEYLQANKCYVAVGGEPFKGKIPYVPPKWKTSQGAVTRAKKEPVVQAKRSSLSRQVQKHSNLEQRNESCHI